MGPRSTSRSTSDDDTLVVGEIRGPHGLRGEVRIDPRTDVAERFAAGVGLDCDGLGPLTIEGRRGPAGQPIVKFAGYERPEDALKLNGKMLRGSRREAPKTNPPGAGP